MTSVPLLSASFFSFLRKHSGRHPNGPQEREAIASARGLYSDGPSIFQLVFRFKPNQVLDLIFEVKVKLPPPQHFEGRRGVPLARTGALLQSHRSSQTVSVMDIM